MKKIIILYIFALLLNNTSTAQDVIIPGEFERNEGLLLKWNYNSQIDSTVARVASAASASAKVWMLYSPAHSTTQAQILEQLQLFGANTTNIEFIEGEAETPWVKDYGPFSGYWVGEQNYIRHFSDAQYDISQYPMADFLPLQLASDFGFNYEALPLNIEFGNLLVDGIGRGFVSDRVLSANPGMNTNQIVQTIYTKLNLNEIIIFPSIPECGGGDWAEISRLVKFVDSETVLVSKFPENVPYYNQIEYIADTLSNTYNDVGRKLKVIRLPVCPDATGEYAITQQGEIRSYTSSIILNNTILIPSYGHPFDAIAYSVYSELFAGSQVVQIPSAMLTAMHGSLFRLAAVIPQPDLFRIKHSKFDGMIPFENELWVNSFVHCFDQVDSIQLFYRIHPSTEWQIMNTYGCCGGNSGFLSGYSIADTVSYYIKAYNNSISQTLPIGAPAAAFTFWFDLYTNLEDKKETQNWFIFPNPASESVEISGLPTDELWEFKLTDIQGRTVLQDKLNNQMKISFPANIPNGLYFLTIKGFGKTHTTKLYLQH